MSDKWLKPYQRTAAGSDLIAMKKQLEKIVSTLLDSTHDQKAMFKANNDASNGLHALLLVAMKDEEIERIEREEIGDNNE